MKKTVSVTSKVPIEKFSLEETYKAMVQDRERLVRVWGIDAYLERVAVLKETINAVRLLQQSQE